MESTPYRRDFIKLFSLTARYRHRYEVFRDFIEMSAISFQNAFLKDDKLEAEYLAIIARYEKPDQQRFPELLGLLVMMLESSREDVLGSIFMELELGSDRAGQFFTPYHISYLMAKLVGGSSREEMLGDRPFVMVQEPACGAGGMIIAYAQHMLELGMNPQKEMWAHCTDIDRVPAMMCYLQLSLLHIPAMVVVGCTIRQTVDRVMRTPAHLLGFWEGKVSRHYSEQSQASPAGPDDVNGPRIVTLEPLPVMAAKLQFDMFAAG